MSFKKKNAPGCRCCTNSYGSVPCNGCRIPKTNLSLSWSWGSYCGEGSYSITGTTATGLIYKNFNGQDYWSTGNGTNAFSAQTGLYEQFTDSTGWRCNYIRMSFSCSGLSYQMEFQESGDDPNQVCLIQGGVADVSSWDCSGNSGVIQLVGQGPHPPHFNCSTFVHGVITL